MPCSEVSGVRSSCEAVATNARRASSWRRSSRCIVANARARSPTSSRPSSRGVGASVPSSATRSAACAQARAAAAPMPVARRDAEQRARRRRPTAAAARNALRTWCDGAWRRRSAACAARATKSRVGSALRTPLARVGHVDGCTTMTVVADARPCVRRRRAIAARIAVARQRLAAEVGVGRRLRAGRRVGDDDARVGALAQRAGAASMRRAARRGARRSGARSRAAGWPRCAAGRAARPRRRVLEVVRGLVGQPLLQRRQQRQRRDRRA